MLTCGSLKVKFLNNYRWQFGARRRPKDRPRGCGIICTYNWQGNQQREWDRVSCILTGFRLKWLITSKASVSLATSSGYCGVVYCWGPGLGHKEMLSQSLLLSNQIFCSVCLLSPSLPKIYFVFLFYLYILNQSIPCLELSAPLCIGKHLQLLTLFFVVKLMPPTHFCS